VGVDSVGKRVDKVEVPEAKKEKESTSSGTTQPKVPKSARLTEGASRRDDDGDHVAQHPEDGVGQKFDVEVIASTQWR